MNYKVKCLNYSSVEKAADDKNIYFRELCSLQGFNDVALFCSSAYRDIFGRARKNDCKRRKLISLVKITFEGNVIFRQYRYDQSIKGINSGYVGLTPESIRLLTEDNKRVLGKEASVNVSKSNNYHMFYWNHPFHATRISYRIGLFALFLSILSIIITIVLSVCN